jgi:hypothetical protein
MKTNWTRSLLVLPAVLVLAMTGCKKDNEEASAATSHMMLRMVDAPSPYAFREVNVDVRGVEANITSMSGQESWVTITAQTGLYNLLELVNGFDVMIGDATVPAGHLNQVRLILGPNNSITDMDGHTFLLTIPSGQESGLKINVNEQIVPGQDFTFYLDFDAGQSVHTTGTGEYMLHPVLRGFIMQNTGTVIGYVNLPSPGVAVMLVKVSDPNTVYMSYAEKNVGHFMLRGLSAGKYTMKVFPAGSDTPVIVEDIEVTAGNTTDVGMVVIGI